MRKSYPDLPQKKARPQNYARTIRSPDGPYRACAELRCWRGQSCRLRYSLRAALSALVLAASLMRLLTDSKTARSLFGKVLEVVYPGNQLSLRLPPRVVVK